MTSILAVGGAPRSAAWPGRLQNNKAANEIDLTNAARMEEIELVDIFYYPHNIRILKTHDF
jgi:hypothetical protein